METLLPQQFNSLGIILNNIHCEKVALKQQDRKEAMKIFNQVIDELWKKLKEEKFIFDSISSGFHFRGSYFGNVKVGNPDEFDVDILLKLPFDYSDIKITVKQGFVQINLKEALKSRMEINTWKDKYGFINKWVDQNGFLIENKVRQYMESMLSKIFNNPKPPVYLENGVKITGYRKSGPAFTFSIEKGHIEMDIDFVFVVVFPNGTLWPSSVSKKYMLPSMLEKNYWYAVPKPNESPILWRLSFPEHESFILSKSGNLKLIYRLLKALRNGQKLNFASYHVASLFFLEDELQNDRLFWKKNAGYLFLHMLQKFIVALKEKKLPFFWDRSANLMKQYSDKHLENMSNCLNRIQNKIIKLLQEGDQNALRTYMDTIIG